MLRRSRYDGPSHFSTMKSHYLLSPVESLKDIFHPVSEIDY